MKIKAKVDKAIQVGLVGWFTQNVLNLFLFFSPRHSESERDVCFEKAIAAKV